MVISGLPVETWAEGNATSLGGRLVPSEEPRCRTSSALEETHPPSVGFDLEWKTDPKLTQEFLQANEEELWTTTVLRVCFSESWFFPVYQDYHGMSAGMGEERSVLRMRRLLLQAANLS